MVEEIKKAGGKAHAFQADVSSRAEMHGLVDAVVLRWGHVDIFVNNSAISGRAIRVEDETEEQVDQLFSVNYKGTLWGIQAASRVLPPGGSIVNISSVGARWTLPVAKFHIVLVVHANSLTLHFEQHNRDFVSTPVSRQQWTP